MTSSAPTPVERLAASRQRLSEGLRAQATPESPAAEAPDWLELIGDLGSGLPAPAVAARWLRRWWSSHPWRSACELGHAVAREVATPIAREHPVALVVGAFAAGALLCVTRPWRWLPGAALAVLLPRGGALSSLLPRGWWHTVQQLLHAAGSDKH